MSQIDIEDNPQLDDCIKMFQAGVVNNFIKKHLSNKTVSAQYKKQFRKALSVFVLYVQSMIGPKRYNKQQLISALQRCHFQKIADDVKNYKQNSEKDNQINRPILQIQNGQVIQIHNNS